MSNKTCKQDNGAHEEALSKIFTKADMVIESTIQDCWDVVGCGSPYLIASQIDDEISRARAHLVNVVSTIKSAEEMVPFVVAWYVVTGIEVLRIEELDGAFLLHLSQSMLRGRLNGVAFLGFPSEPSIQIEAYDFCDVWLSSEGQRPLVTALKCSQFSSSDLARFLTALFILRYVDEYFWDITNAPGLKQAMLQVAEKYTGFRWEQISLMEQRWQQFRRLAR